MTNRGKTREEPPLQHPPEDALEDTLRQMRAAIGGQPLGERYMHRMRRRNFLRCGLLAGTGVICAGTGLTLSRPDALTDWSADIRTHTGKIDLVTLASGAQLTLAPRSAVKLDDFNHFSLWHGAAIVNDLQARSMSLQVKTRHGVVELNHQEAQIRTNHAQLEVVSHNDTVKIAARNGRDYHVRAGERMLLTGNDAYISPAEWTAATAWTGGQLIVDNAPMQDVIEAFRPYWPGSLYISARAARVPVAGVFSLTSVEQSIEQITEIFPVKVVDMPFQTRIIVSLT